MDGEARRNISQPRAGDSEDAADVNNATDLEKADVAIGRKLASRRDHPAVKAASIADKIGDQEPLYAISAALLVCGLALRDRRLAGSGGAMLAAITLADFGKSGVKRLVSRTRPHVLLDEQRYDTDAGGSQEKPEQSFPSGHMAGSVATARALSRNYPRAGLAAGVAAIAIGFSRMAKGAHWPLDVVGGAIIGLAAEAVGTALLSRGLAAVPQQWLAALHLDEDGESREFLPLRKMRAR